jgi:hypothetical protein
LVEQRIENPRVDGSIPSQATNPNPSISNVARVFFLHSENPPIFQILFASRLFSPLTILAAKNETQCTDG